MLKKEYSKDLTRLNTFGMKVTARYFYEYDSLADLLDLDFEDLARPVKHIGGGSNLLFTGDFPGTLLHSAIRFTEILSESADEVTVSVGAGVGSISGVKKPAQPKSSADSSSTKIKRFISENPAPFQRFCKRDFIGIFEIAADRNAVRDARRRDAERL